LPIGWEVEDITGREKSAWIAFLSSVALSTRVLPSTSLEAMEEGFVESLSRELEDE